MTGPGTFGRFSKFPFSDLQVAYIMEITLGRDITMFGQVIHVIILK